MTTERPYCLEDIRVELVQGFQTNREFLEVSMDLLKLVLDEAQVFAALIPTNSPGWKRNDAILCGFMVRICKLGIGLNDLMIDGRSELSDIIMRCLYESSVKLQYLIKMDSSEEFDRYVLVSSEPEAKLQSLILKNMQERGGESHPIEDRMIESMKGYREADFLNEEFRKWKDMRTLGNEIGLGDESYIGGFQVPSASVHGYTTELFRHHLTQVDQEYFLPAFEWTGAKPQQALGVVWYLLQALNAYVKYRYKENSVPILNHLEEFMDRFFMIDEHHERYLQRRDGDS